MAVSIRLDITQNYRDNPTNRSFVTVKLYCDWTYGSYNHKSPSGTVYIDGTKYTFSANINPNNTTTGSSVLRSWGVYINHNPDGTKTLACTASFNTGLNSGTVTATAIKELEKIDGYPVLKSAPNFNDEGNPTITYSNPSGLNAGKLRACISLDGSKDDIAYRDIDKTLGTYTFNLTDAERKVLRQATTTSNSRQVRFYLYYESKTGDVVRRTYLAKNFTIVNANPVLNPTVTCNQSELTGNTNTVVKGHNTIAVNSGATALKEATIKKYEITCGGKKLTTASGTLTNVESDTFVFKVTDSRGNTATKTVVKSFVNYIDLTCHLNVIPPTPDGELSYTISGNYFNGSFGAKNNSLALWIRRKVNDEEWGDWIHHSITLNGNSYSIAVTQMGLDYESSYSYQAKVADLIYPLAQAVESEIKRVKTTPVFDWGENDFNFNVNVNFPNTNFNNANIGIRSTNSEGTSISALVPCTQEDVLMLGWGNYNAGIGRTNIYGNNINLFTTDGNGDIGINGSVSINGRTYGANQILWSGSYYMTDGQTASLTDSVSNQPNGIVLVFSRYANGEAENSNFNCHFVPKYMVAQHGSAGHCFNMFTVNQSLACSKYLYISDTEINGNELNNATGTGTNAIKYNNAAYVLRYVIGV